MSVVAQCSTLDQKHKNIKYIKKKTVVKNIADVFCLLAHAAGGTIE